MRIVIIFLVIILSVIIAILLFQKSASRQKLPSLAKPTETSTMKSVMKLSSQSFGENKEIPQKYSCDGQGINPGLTITDVPNNAKSLALIMDDSDAPMGTF